MVELGLGERRSWYLTCVVSTNAPHLALVEAVNFRPVSVLEDDQRAIGNVTLRSNNLHVTVHIGDPKFLHCYCPS
jgi:hypothetical protein